MSISPWLQWLINSLATAECNGRRQWVLRTSSHCYSRSVRFLLPSFRPLLFSCSPSTLSAFYHGKHCTTKFYAKTFWPFPVLITRKEHMHRFEITDTLLLLLKLLWPKLCYIMGWLAELGSLVFLVTQIKWKLMNAYRLWSFHCSSCNRCVWPLTFLFPQTFVKEDLLDLLLWEEMASTIVGAATPLDDER